MKMVSRKISAIYTGALLFFSIAVFILLLGILIVRYEGLISWVVIKLKKPELETLLRNRALPLEKFQLVQKLAMAGLLLVPILFFICFKFRQFFIRQIEFLVQTLRGAFYSWSAVFHAHSKTEKIAFYTALILISARSLFYIISRDLQYDEMWSYNYFTAPPFYFSFFMYNNYPFYEILTHFFKWLPFSDKINLRLPVLISGLLVCSVLYFYLFKYFKQQFPALAGMLLFALLPPATTYMLYGRGVILEMLFAIIALFSILQWLDSTDKNGQLLLFILANILGVYAMPSHIYCWICLILLVFLTVKMNKTLLRKFLLTNLLIGLGIFICYLPVLLGSGISYLISIVQPAESLKNIWLDLPRRLGYLSYFITGNLWGLMVIVIACVIMLLKRKPFAHFEKLILVSLLFCLFPVLISVIQRIDFPGRAFAFIELAPVLVISVVAYFAGFILRTGIRYALLVLIVVSTAAVSHSHSSINWSRTLDKQVKELSRILLDKGVNNCYDNSGGSYFSYYYPGIEYYYRQAGRTITLIPNDPRSLRFKPFSAADHYDCLVMPADSLSAAGLENYHLIYQRPEEKFEVFSMR